MKRRDFLLRISRVALATPFLVSYRSDEEGLPDWSLRVPVQQLLLFPSCRRTRQPHPDWCRGEDLETTRWRYRDGSVIVSFSNGQILQFDGHRSFNEMLSARSEKADRLAVSAVSLASWAFDALWKSVRSSKHYRQLPTHYAAAHADFERLQEMDVLRSVGLADIVELIRQTKSLDIVGEVVWYPKKRQFLVKRDPSPEREGAAANPIKAQRNERVLNPPKTKEEKDIAERIRRIATEQLGVSYEETVLESSIFEDLGGDSLDMVQMIMAMEEEFSIKIPNSEACRLQRLWDFYAYIRQRLLIQ